MDIEFSQIHEMDYMHDIVNSDSKKKPRIPLKKFLNVSHILFEQAKIHPTDIASLYYYRALVHFHNEKIACAKVVLCLKYRYI